MVNKESNKTNKIQIASWDVVMFAFGQRYWIIPINITEINVIVKLQLQIMEM